MANTESSWKGWNSPNINSSFSLVLVGILPQHTDNLMGETTHIFQGKKGHEYPPYLDYHACV